MARRFWRRVAGLIGARRLFLFIPRCRAVHTHFMRSPIDIVFLDDHHVVLSVVARARPWRVYVGPRIAASVLELEPGTAEQIGLAAGDRVLVSI